MLQPPLFRWQRWMRISVAAGIILVLVVLSLLPRTALGLMPPCTFKNLTGLPCALCGGTRSAHALLHGDVATALYLNPLALVAVGLLGVVALVLLWEGFRGRAAADWSAVPARIRPWMSLTFVILLLLWWTSHVLGAVKTPKKELVELRNPMAAALYRQFHKSDAR
jgi:hypothetical protein